MNTAKQEKNDTRNRFYILPDKEHTTSTDGQIYMKHAPTTKHQLLVSMLNTEIGSYIKKNNGACKVIPAPFAVFLNAEQKQPLEPDLSIICDPNKIDEKGCHGAPDWVIEVVSPSSIHSDYVRKKSLYI